MILGNHDACAIGLTAVEQFNDYARKALEFTSSVIDDYSREILSSAELTHEIEGALLTHATPYQPVGWSYCLSVAQAEHQFRNFTSQVCFIGHSHFPIVFDRNSTSITKHHASGSIRLESEHRYIINVGSVGQPRDGDPRACYACFDTEAGEVGYRRVSYDIEAAQNAMRQHNLPGFLIERLLRGR
jgi:diadenosine tetraphosphatase ApaH/serine/threonine PP2A family protein phosphatase